MNIQAILDKQAGSAAYLVNRLKEGLTITKQDSKFLNAWLSAEKARAAVAAGKPIPKCGRAGRRKKVLTGYGN
jgi:hypothetical protein